MNFEPFSPFEYSETLPPPAPTATPATDTDRPPPAHYFDRVGCVWIVACVLLAGTAGRMLPTLAEPGGLQHAWAAMVDKGTAHPPTTLASLPPHGTYPAEATRAASPKQQIGPLVPAILRQY
nr:hypothetical protein [uncultured Albidiferax sp.]